MDLEPLRAGVAMTWGSLDERERMIVLYAAVCLVFWALGAVQRRSRDTLRDEILEELTARGGVRA